MLKVLIVDDEPWVLEGLRTMIDWGKYGYEVCAEAHNGRDAMKLIEEYKPELVLTDINMPVINGLELISTMNEAMEKPPRFVILTGYDDFQYARVALRQRVNEYLLKPIDDEEIDALLKRITPLINNEIASNEEMEKKQYFIINNLINRLIQGEYHENIEGLARSAMKLQENAELMCILFEPATSMNLFHPQGINSFPKNAYHFFRDGSGRSGIIVQTGSIGNESVEAFMNTIYSVLAEQAPEQALLAVSNKMVGVCSIREIYMQALEVWKQKMHQQKRGIFVCCEHRGIKKNEQLEDNFKQLLDKVEACNTEEIPSCVKKTFGSFADCLLTTETIQAKVAHLELSVCSLIAQMNGDPDTIMSKLQEEYGNLGELSEYCVLSRYVESLCMLATEYLSELKQNNEKNTIYKVVQYVDQEYRNKLKLQDLARQFHINSIYLGQLFRKQTGQSFSEYLNAKRIEEAKSLLKRTQLKISDIALQVGFSNTDYFIDKFKQTVGVVPSVYKNENK